MTAPTDSLADLLGGKRGALDVTAPPLAFAIGWLAAGQSIGWGSVVALAVAAGIAVWRLSRGEKIVAVLGGLGAVAVGALIALYTGRAEDFFLVQLLSNALSALAFALSILVRWPLLGVIVGLLLGQKARWRRDPALVRAYGRASWVWTGQYLLRVLVYGYLWWSAQVVALTVARVAMSWPLFAVVLAVSALVLQRSLPEGHPGIRHPRAARD
ncbi:DUF3159 domain-containing protein [Actinokineospora pegani]|uniref:DUF3159 domain-containing protein n=1 Tax=Actinokineospora pegani TaxID=2654637 RepID=UPI0012EADAA7|nr:DUF3159 domain-containing protein [Actinokineospora pegani]